MFGGGLYLWRCGIYEHCLQFVLFWVGLFFVFLGGEGGGLQGRRRRKEKGACADSSDRSAEALNKPSKQFVCSLFCFGLGFFFWGGGGGGLQGRRRRRKEKGACADLSDRSAEALNKPSKQGHRGTAL